MTFSHEDTGRLTGYLSDVKALQSGGGGSSHRVTTCFRVDPVTQNNVVTVHGVSRSEVDAVFADLRERFPDHFYHHDGQRTLWLDDSDVFIHDYQSSGGELELVSYVLTFELLLELLPEAIRQKLNRLPDS